MDEDTALFELSPIMKIEDCQRLHAFLVSASDKNIAFQCSAVDRVSGLTAQMLAMACKSWGARALHVDFLNVSSGFKDGLALLGLSELLCRDEVPV